MKELLTIVTATSLLIIAGSLLGIALILADYVGRMP